MKLINNISKKLHELIPGDEIHDPEIINNQRLIITKLGMDGLDDMYQYLRKSIFYRNLDIQPHKSKMDTENYTSKMILQIHDELLFEGPPEEMDKLSTLVVGEMEAAMALSIPLKVDWKIGKNWYEAH